MSNAPQSSHTSLAVAPAAAVAWSAELEGARMLLKSGLAPQSLKTPESAMFVILVGRDLGLSPTQSLRSVNVIQGKVEVAADMQLALFKRAGGKASWASLTASEAVLDLTHPNGDKHRESFTAADAQRAGLTGANWSKYPKAMLRSRCITAGMKSVGFDALAGVYDEGEISGVEPTIEAAAPAAPAVEPEAPAPEYVDETTGEILTPALIVPAAVVRAVTPGVEVPPIVPSDALTTAREYVIPFGFLKGKAVGEVPAETLRKSLAWALEKNPDRFAAFIDAARFVLDDAGEPVPAMATHAGPDDSDDLPF